MKGFIYDIPTKVYFGSKVVEGNLGKELARYGKRVLLVYGGGSIRKSGLYDEVCREAREQGLEITELSGIEPNPKISSVRKGAEICKEKQIDMVLAVGGGSVIDAAKFIAAGAKIEEDPWKLVTREMKIEEALPVITVLTLSATGSEMDGVGVISNPDTNEKLGNGAGVLRPKVSFLDPENTYTVSRYQTACGSADIISHILEIYFTPDGGMYLLNRFMEGILRTVIHYAPEAMENPENYEARANLMWASSWAINDFAGSCSPNTWSCHAMEHELSAFYDITHGLGLAILTPAWMEYCLEKHSDTAKKFAEFTVNVFGIGSDLPEKDAAKLGIERIRTFFKETLGLPSTLTEIGIGREHFEQMAEKACKAGGLAYAYRPLTPEDVRNIYEMCL